MSVPNTEISQFNQKQSLISHKKSVHGVLLKCELCDKQFVDHHQIDKHKESIHGESINYCYLDILDNQVVLEEVIEHLREMETVGSSYEEVNTLGVIGSTTSTVDMLTRTEILKTKQIQEGKLTRTRQFKMEAVTEMEAPAFWREDQPSSATSKLETSDVR